MSIAALPVIFLRVQSLAILKNNFNDTGLSDIHIYMKMIEKDSISYTVINNYYDTGTVESYQKANRKLVSKYDVLFKLEESISFLDNKVIKFFSDSMINIERMKRIKYIGEKNIPKIYSFSENFISMEILKSKPISKIHDFKIIKKLLHWAKLN